MKRAASGSSLEHTCKWTKSSMWIQSFPPYNRFNSTGAVQNPPGTQKAKFTIRSTSEGEWTVSCAGRGSCSEASDRLFCAVVASRNFETSGRGDFGDFGTGRGDSVMEDLIPRIPAVALQDDVVSPGAGAGSRGGGWCRAVSCPDPGGEAPSGEGASGVRMVSVSSGKMRSRPGVASREMLRGAGEGRNVESLFGAGVFQGDPWKIMT